MLRIGIKCGAGLGTVLMFWIWLASATLIAAEPIKTARVADAKTLAAGRELFEREWLPNDPRAHGGDGLGPVFNESSCVACHNQGGSGGGGADSKNVQLVTAVMNGAQPQPAPQVMSESNRSGIGPALRGVMRTLDSALIAGEQLRQQREQERLQREQVELFKKKVKELHPGLATSRSVVLHRFGTDKGYSKWRGHITGIDQQFGIVDQGHDSFDATAASETGLNRPIVGAASQLPATTQLLPDQVADAPASEIPGVKQAEAALSQLKEAVFGPEPLAVEPPTPAFSQGISERQKMMATAQSFRFGGSQGQFENVVFLTTQRNSTSLFGAGLIDGIPDHVLEDAAKVTHRNFPEITGRVSRMKDGKVGRFGWKSQKAHLYDFAMTACAIELGLQVPDHPQSGLPHKRDYKPTGLDMNKAECDALVEFLRLLPAPRRTTITDPAVSGILAEGEKLFVQVGCAACHTPKLGDVEGLYSDLLLHDMGQQLVDHSGYGSFIPGSPGDEDESSNTSNNGLVGVDVFQPNPNLPGFSEISPIARNRKSAAEFEWRTAALWGVRDSAPYLHDGRASTLEDAIAFHGGEALRSSEAYFHLSQTERHKLLAFLKTLGAPEPTAVVAK